MKDIIIRAAKTFIQAALSYVCTMNFIDTDYTNRKLLVGLLLSAGAAGISAIMNIDWTKVGQEKEKKNEFAQTHTH